MVTPTISYLGGIVINKLLSIVVPVYNKEKFLEQCVQSLIALEMNSNDYEVIFVDDQSTDQSYNLLRRYEEEYEFIHCYQLAENSGSPSQPRNVGIDKANGQFITLLDADDWLDPVGVPKLLFQMIDNQSDIGFGQPYVHRDKSISKIARFSSYKFANNLVPYEIEKVFRAVGPPGKIFKRSTIVENNIKFEHMKYGEDKLFFTEVISLSNKASMSPLATYHVNRYSENVSLVKETNMLEKSICNLEVLKKIIKLNIPKLAMKQVLSRIVEIDYINRFLVTKTFLNSEEREVFFTKFNEVIDIINATEFDIEELLTSAHSRNVYTFFNTNKDDLITYVYETLLTTKTQKIIKDDVVYKYFNKVTPQNNVFIPCYPVYNGTRLFDSASYDVISILKPESVVITKVLLTKVNDESVNKAIDFTFDDSTNLLYLKHSDVKFEDNKFNIEIIYNDYNSALVYASFPNNGDAQEQLRQNFKLEMTPISNDKEMLSKYLTKQPKHVIVKKKIKCYSDADFKNEEAEISSGKLLEIIGMEKSSKGTPRLITNSQYFVTANTNFVKPINVEELVDYVTDVPHSVEIIKNCKLYETTNFKKEAIKNLSTGQTYSISAIEYTINGTPRLKTSDGYYLTANKKFIKVVK